MVNVPNEEDLLEKLKKIQNVEPRAEFVHSLEEMLTQKARKIRIRRRARWLVTGVAACAVLIVTISLTVLSDKQLFTNTLANLQAKLSPLLPDPGEKLLNGKLNLQAQQTLDALTYIMPELQQMEKTVKLSQKENEQMYLVRFRPKGEKKLYAWIDIQANSGGLDSLMLAKEAEKATTPPSAAQAKESAGAFLKVLLGKEFDQYQGEANADTVQTWRNVQFKRYVNGLPLESDSYSLEVNGAGKVMDVEVGKHARKNLNLKLFPAPAEADGKVAEQVIAQFMKLTYVNSSKGITMEYEPAFSGYLDAKTGEAVASDSPRLPYTRLPYTPISVTPGGKQVMAKTMEEAAKVAASEFGLDLKGQPFVQSNIPKEMLDENEVEYKTADRSITLSTINGRVVHFSRSLVNAPVSAKAVLSQEQATQRAVQFLQTYLAPDVKEMFYTVKEDMNEIPQLEFSFFLSHQGIPVFGSRCTVSVDLTDGSIVSYRDELRALPAQLPDKASAISAEAAAVALLKQNPPQLTYVYPEQNGKPAVAPVLAYYVKPDSIPALPMK
ncbi:DUF4901 domain-containing protein [Brevibacillus laterosporus]|uniref:DUF4901 domain-containing protein n=1 Tax=Brevibacillus laterosporus TaxID=1465 RepID=A0AAP3DKL1_BRELA|nr:DUF4901 domain-containing protein [Brevibacillus laterosporus]MCR8983033.1 DUF4901 domain-containing protein [Brevibacillus laterosporus]MCZ0810189.1 DUF4901 domain-containing protein [Brevibacillus laterosporus]MCZ0828815.1 DUF4901 domain-containing protein [Brevibacillus laterosporus]MCZ0852831.1 DUF4901 domain-containing protein [Brevibacillus laterosporus]